MIVKITKYDAVKGLGEYVEPSGEKVSFRYYKFADKVITPFNFAVIKESKLHKASFIGGISWRVRRLIKWLL